MANYIKYGTREYNIEELTYLKNGNEVSVDKLPYKEHYDIEVIYTANWVWQEFSEEYNLTPEQCVEVADRARYYMDNYDIDEHDAVYEALNYFKFEEVEKEE